MALLGPGAAALWEETSLRSRFPRLVSRRASRRICYARSWAQGLRRALCCCQEKAGGPRTLLGRLVLVSLSCKCKAALISDALCCQPESLVPFCSQPLCLSACIPAHDVRQ